MKNYLRNASQFSRKVFLHKSPGAPSTSAREKGFLLEFIADCGIVYDATAKPRTSERV